MKVKDIAGVIEKIAPKVLAQDWDNVGLLVGDSQRHVKNILLTIDITAAVISEAQKLKADLIISYHPVIWDGLKSVTADGPGKIVYELINKGISVISIHTALDVAAGGVNDGLAEIIGIENGRPIGDWVEYDEQIKYKLVVYVPQNALKVVSNAVFTAGAGAIGNYSYCGFSGEGTGTFKPLEGANPTIGDKGRLEQVAEYRFETIVPGDKLEAVIDAMKKVHPYECPAYDVFRLYNEQKQFGLGRIGKLKKPTPLWKIIEHIRNATGAKAVGMVGPEKRLVETAAVCAGSCSKIINHVIAEGVDLYLTGEIKHHQALAAQEAGLTCICLSHTVSERFILKKVQSRLKSYVKDINIKISKKDADPFKWKNL